MRLSLSVQRNVTYPPLKLFLTHCSIKQLPRVIRNIARCGRVIFRFSLQLDQCDFVTCSASHCVELILANFLHRSVAKKLNIRCKAKDGLGCFFANIQQISILCHAFASSAAKDYYLVTTDCYHSCYAAAIRSLANLLPRLV